MNDINPFNADSLRAPENVHEPDPRNEYFVSLDQETGQLSPITIRKQHDDVATITLNPSAPDDVVAQLETTKNLYLYAWFVYRFYPVAEHHSLACLELALRMRFHDDILAERIPC